MSCLVCFRQRLIRVTCLLTRGQLGIGVRDSYIFLLEQGLTCQAFARAGSTAGSPDRAHTGSGSHAGDSLGEAEIYGARLSRENVRPLSDNKGKNIPGCHFKANFR